jgi:hypothetical protein
MDLFGDFFTWSFLGDVLVFWMIYSRIPRVSEFWREMRGFSRQNLESRGAFKLLKLIKEGEFYTLQLLVFPIFGGKLSLFPILCFNSLTFQEVCVTSYR